MGFYKLFRWCLVFIALACTSCVDLVSDFRIDNDGSGTLALSYTLSKALLNLGAIDEENKFYAFPISEEDFEKTVGGIAGLTLTSFSESEDVDDISVEARLSFRSIEALSELMSTSGPGGVELLTNGEETIFRYTVFDGTGAEVDEESAEMIDTFFGEHSASFSIRAASDITSVSGGTFSGRTATVEYSVPELIKSTDAVIWEVKW